MFQTLMRRILILPLAEHSTTSPLGGWVDEKELIIIIIVCLEGHTRELK